LHPHPLEKILPGLLPTASTSIPFCMVWALLLRASSDASSPLPHDFADLSHMSLCCPSSRQKSPSLFSCSPQGAVPHLRSSLCFSTFFSCNVSFWGWGDWNYMQYSRYVRTMDLHSGM